VNWESPASLANKYGLADRTSIYRHAHALNLFEKRKRNVRAALERIIEKSGEVEVTASAIVAAIQAYAKINAQGQWVERSEHGSPRAAAGDRRLLENGPDHLDPVTTKDCRLYSPGQWETQSRQPGRGSVAMGGAGKVSASA